MSDLTESVIKSQIKELLQRSGWKVVDTSDKRRTAPGMKGFPDLEAFRRMYLFGFASEATVTLLIETKTRTGELTPDEQKFREDIEPYRSNTLLYLIARDVEHVEKLLSIL